MAQKFSNTYINTSLSFSSTKAVLKLKPFILALHYFVTFYYAGDNFRCLHSKRFQQMSQETKHGGALRLNRI